MATQLIAALASAALIGTGAAAVSSTRSADALPVQHYALVHSASAHAVAGCRAGGVNAKVSTRCASNLIDGGASGAGGAGLLGGGGAGTGVAIGGGALLIGGATYLVVHNSSNG